MDPCFSESEDSIILKVEDDGAGMSQGKNRSN